MFKAGSPSPRDAPAAPISQLLQEDVKPPVGWKERGHRDDMMRLPARWRPHVHGGAPDLGLGVARLSEAPCPSSPLGGDVFFCSFALCSSSMSCFERLLAAHESRLTVSQVNTSTLGKEKVVSHL